MSSTENTSTSTSLLTRSEVKGASFDFVAAVKAVKAKTGEMSLIRGGALWNASLIYGEAKGRDLIGSKDGALWPTQGNYAASAGLSASAGTLLNYLSQWQGKGAKHSTATWTFLCDYATNGRVVDVMKAEGATLKNLASLMAEAKTEGKLTGRPKTAQPSDGSESSESSDSESSESGAPVTVVPTIGDVEASLRTIREVVHGFGKEDRKRAIAALEAVTAHLIDREVTLSKATPATVAKSSKAKTPAAA